MKLKTDANTKSPAPKMLGDLNLSAPYTETYGRGKLRYMQGGRGFDSKGKCLGLYSAQGDRTGDAPPAAAPAPTPVTVASSAALLAGSNVVAAFEVAPGKTVPAEAVVQYAFAASGASKEDWNAMDPEDRDALLEAALDAMRAEERARNEDGTFKGDNPDTPDVNEAFKDGDQPDPEPAADDTKAREYFSGLHHATLRKMLTDAGIEIPEGTDKAGMVDMAVERLEIEEEGA